MSTRRSRRSVPNLRAARGDLQATRALLRERQTKRSRTWRAACHLPSIERGHDWSRFSKSAMSTKKLRRSDQELGIFKDLYEMSLVTSSSSFLLSSLELSNTKVYEPQIRALLGTATHFCQAVVLIFSHTGTTLSRPQTTSKPTMRSQQSQLCDDPLSPLP